MPPSSNTSHASCSFTRERQLEMQQNRARCRLPLLAIGVLAVIVFCVLLKARQLVQESRDVNLPTTSSLEKGLLQEESKTANKKAHFLIASGFSSNHFDEARDMIASAQKYLPTRRILVYDLGLQEDQKKELKTFCNVELRAFDFNQYPPHFKSLRKYAWKPVIIRDLLVHETEHLFWADASIRFVKDFETALSKLDKFPLKGHHHEFEIIQVTHSGMLDYFNMTRESMRNVVGIEGGLVLYKSNEVSMHIIDLWCDCAIHEECIAPKTSALLSCNFNLVKKGSVEYIGCHRYDQSALNVIIVREYGTEVYKYILDSIINRSLQVIKHASHEYTVQKC